MRLEHFEAHLNELLHDLSSPLNTMRLQLGLLRDALRHDQRLLKRVESTERQVLRAQSIIDAFVASCATKPGRAEAGAVFARVFDRFGIELNRTADDVVVAISEKSLTELVRSLAEGCVTLMTKGTPTGMLRVENDSLVVRVEGEFEQRTVGRALRLSFVNEAGVPVLALAATRLRAASANGTLLLERNALVLRLPLASE